MIKDIDCLVMGYAGVDRILYIPKHCEYESNFELLNKNHRNVTYGGNGSNIAACMGKLGCHVRPIMRVGIDWESLGYKQMMLDSGLDISDVRVIKNESTSICHLIEDQNSDHITLTYPGAMDEKYSDYPLNQEVFDRAKYGIICAAAKMDVEKFYQAALKAKLPLVLSMRIDYSSFPQPLLAILLRDAEIIFANKIERQLIEADPELELPNIENLFIIGHAKIIVITMGADGSLIYEKQGENLRKSRIPAIKCDNAVDFTGAGDSFIAGFMYGLLKGMDPISCAQYGSTTAAFIIEKQGCTTNMPNIKQVEVRKKLNYDSIK